MDVATRNALSRTVTIVRTTLEGDVSSQLESRFGVHPDGRVEPLSSLPNLTGNPRAASQRARIVEAINHLREKTPGAAGGRVDDATGGRFEDGKLLVGAFTRFTAFTTLNRLAAIKLLEARGAIIESIGRGANSQAVQYLRSIAAPALSPGEDGLELHLRLLFAELAPQSPAVFENDGPYTLVEPTRTALNAVLDALGDPGIESVWQADETLGWIFQYFTPEEERRRVRKESQAPRDANELAFRNQFFTPDYVVRFLVQNTLGRLWLDMHPDSELAANWEYLLRDAGPRPKTAPRDPRTLRVLDPACGSGHFLLYAYDLLEAMHQEARARAWTPRELESDEEYSQRLPGVIIANNLFGVDIDRRAAQLAQFALALRARRSHPQALLTRSGIVTAEPLPGSRDLLDSFLNERYPGQLGVRRLVEAAWEDLQNADELGLLLRTDERLARLSGTRAGSGGDFFDGPYQKLEAQVADALRAFAGQNAPLRARLFAQDGVEGFRLLELMRQPYDVVLMNPPFGAAAKRTKPLFEKLYPNTKNDLYAAFVERGLQLLRPGGRLGAISSRTGFFLKSFTKWREDVLLAKSHVAVVADLGYGVLDKAMVETAAYVLEKNGGAA